jgi:uncharacterized protein YjbI with pentapeptide repeats
MANDEHLRIIRQGATVWNLWREENIGATPNLIGADLRELDLSTANLVRADLRNSDLSQTNLSKAHLTDAALTSARLVKANLSSARISGADLSAADLREANLREARLVGSNLTQADLSAADLSESNLSDANAHEGTLIGTKLVRASVIATDLGWARLQSADLTGADLSWANFNRADLRNVNLSKTNLSDTNFRSADLDESDFREATMWGAVFGNNDLSTIKGLETVVHRGPSTIGIDSLYKSNGKIPEVFLRGAGILEDFITFVPSLVGQAIEFYSCFISYSHKDEEFSRRLHSRMRSENLRVWYAPEDMKGGRKLHEEIFRAIQIHDKLLLVLSENSMRSQWVITEIKRAKKVEREEQRRKLFPIRLIDFETIQSWECFDADSGKDLAAEVREYYIPDFSNWKDHDSFEREFAKLLGALKATEK